jgi:general stress protein 26
MEMSDQVSQQRLERFWKDLSEPRTGMLWLPDSGQHPQPMTHFVDEDEGCLWFIASSRSDLIEALSPGATARFTTVSTSHEFYVSLIGTMSVSDDRSKLDEFWTNSASASFEEGQDDDKVRLLRFDPEEAAIWQSEGSTMLVALRVMQAAHSSGVVRDVGRHEILTLKATQQ